MMILITIANPEKPKSLSITSYSHNRHIGETLIPSANPQTPEAETILLARVVAELIATARDYYKL